MRPLANTMSWIPLGTSQKPLGNLSGTSWKPLGTSRILMRPLANHLLDTSRNLSETSRKPLGDLLETSRNLSETSRKQFIAMMFEASPHSGPLSSKDLLFISMNPSSLTP